MSTTTDTDTDTVVQPGHRARIRRLITARQRSSRRDDRGQATSEYGLVILVAAGIALGVIAWASQTEAFTGLFDTIVERLTSDL
jgi:Flp pilus assembly pilin Flp